MKKSKEQCSMAALEKELRIVDKREGQLLKAAGRQKPSNWKQQLESKVPDKVYDSLEKAFCKAFFIIFEKGTDVIEKSYSKEAIREEHMVQDYAFQVKASRKVLRKIGSNAAMANRKNTVLTTIEGIGLGALGIGMPDIVLFVGMLLRGSYEVALHYGFDYTQPEERYFILKMIETSMKTGDEWEENNAEINRIIAGTEKRTIQPEEIKSQMEQTASVLAMDMLLLKFIQGLPVAGIIGGAGNPVYYNKVMRYVNLKYRKRYLIGLRNRIG